MNLKVMLRQIVALYRTMLPSAIRTDEQSGFGAYADSAMHASQIL